ncbi:glycoside hydrolase family 66 protein [Deinococcus roseus]|uniref:Cycloisomaltooligosaccharide glucanotransferase n=1 Tax=Deinococcus roseus TaxID=392414 RepID=A0ABQ2D5Y8_9DEIO|nr:glycoside hydrolase family 66 protein [Deinococcus roseus]GGJ47391.1 cycloisomaltooligosaccharide glucanotransferase [Deinococcus roseus]
MPIRKPVTFAQAALLLGLTLPACSQTTPTPPAPLPILSTNAPLKVFTLINTNKAIYNPGDEVQLWADLNNQSGKAINGKVVLRITHLGKKAAEDREEELTLAEGASGTVSFKWVTPKDQDYTGYQLELRILDDKDTLIENDVVAVDVSSDWTKFPRYGYVSDYGTGFDAWNKIWRMKNHHINAIQFYDWQWQHHRPYSPDSTWKEIANRTVDRGTVSTFISAAHDYNMLAMNYNLIAGGFDNYWSDGSGAQLAWGAFKNDHPTTPADQDHHPLPSGWATEKLYQFNPANPDWQKYIYAEEKKAFDHLGFDGWHMDTLGGRGSLWTWDGQPIDLKSTFSGFIDNAKTALDKHIVFNTVGNYGLEEIAGNPNLDVIYSELWDDSSTDDYVDINATVDRIRALTDKAIVFPAYMNRDLCNSTPDGQTDTFNLHSVLLADATIFASGATHLELGDGDNMLCTEYFPNKKLQMSAELKRAMLTYYNFQTAYENLLMDGTKTSTAKTDLGSVPSSTTGSKGKVWTLRKEKAGLDVLHLINLSKNFSSKWRDKTAEYEEPNQINNTSTKLYYSGSLADSKKLFFASPDFDRGVAHELTYQKGSDKDGNFVQFNVPILKYWTTVWLER